ncbi:flavin reductase family protein [Parasedimentitalea maritima]|uniref:Flavin reductase n=1 Tax=Parasedimentitalea maritima TaxID=2578117 RepID=A0A5R8Z4C7_9RHOB|nr:flavin reductase family protein [Zongyanglinia marina]KAE9631509.1 flavin reductase [Zongyanglinia marina]TLP60424.1 flavin reductase family protein [Zongyanglinia marina]
MSESNFTPGPDTVRAYRDALGCFGTGVTVVTTLTPRGPLAITANSFTSVSMDPPLLLWCPAKNSLRHNAFIDADHFTIHIMGENQLDLAKHFARNGEDFEPVSWQPNAVGTPTLPDCIARFDCRHFARHPGGDHSILIGEVLSATTRPGKGLIFKQGLYGGFLEQN